MKSKDEEPRYFRLLSDADVRLLKPVIELLKEERKAILERWHQLYVEHFAAARSLDRTGFEEVHGKELDALTGNLLEGDVDGFEADVRALGRDLVERGVPFAEVVVSMHLFEEATAEFVKKRFNGQAGTPSLYMHFDKLSHCRIILLSSTYNAAHQSAVWERTTGLEHEATELAGGPSRRKSFHGLLGGSAAMQRLYEQVASTAPASAPVLVLGERGTGKEVVARAIHELGGPERPFVRVNASALQWTNGNGNGGIWTGLLRSAAGGTLFLDEIAEMSREGQQKLVERFDAGVEARVIASTSRDPEGAVGAGSLVGALFQKLNVHRLGVPPLRERVDDVPLLLKHFAGIFGSEGMRRIVGFEPDALESLRRYTWPGNVRELRNLVEYVLAVGKTPRVRVADLPSYVVAAAGPVRGPNAVPTMADAEKELIERALAANHGNKVQAAKMLRISRHRLYDKIKKFAIVG